MHVAQGQGRGSEAGGGDFFGELPGERGDHGDWEGLLASEIRERDPSLPVRLRPLDRDTGPVEDDGSVLLGFYGTPVRLQEWTITDAQGGRTRTQLTSLSAAPGLAASLFQLRDPTRRPGRN